ncbi:MAG: hypothetical protein EBR82_86570 [Caulobacteraceae bacterium]|nr:hypothetical protein [Caulobacteraceae bacterium]
MRVAVILVGQMRTWETCLHTFKWHVARKFECPMDFFVSTVQDEQMASAELIRLHFPEARLEIDAKESQPQIPEPTELVRFEPYARSVPVQAVLRQLWQLSEAWKFFNRFDDGQYDIVIRSRPDLFFHSFQLPERMPGKFDALTPWWGRFGGINDRFAIMGWNAARAYFTTYDRLYHLLPIGCPLHPESLVAGSLALDDCTTTTALKAEFSTLRLTGEMRAPEISGIDLAHCALAS